MTYLCVTEVWDYAVLEKNESEGDREICASSAAVKSFVHLHQVNFAALLLSHFAIGCSLIQAIAWYR